MSWLEKTGVEGYDSWQITYGKDSIMTFTVQRAILNQGRHLTNGTRDRWINYATHRLLDNDKKERMRASIWRAIRRNPANPRLAISEDFVWSLFGRGSGLTAPVDFETDRDVRAFCVWLQHSEPLRQWFYATLNNDIAWNPDREDVNFAREPDFDANSILTSPDVVKNFALNHRKMLMQYAPLIFAEPANAILEKLIPEQLNLDADANDSELSDEELTALLEAFSSPSVHPHLDITVEKLTNLLKAHDHNTQLEMYVALNPQWVELLKETDWAKSVTHQYLGSAIQLQEKINEANRENAKGIKDALFNENATFRFQNLTELEAYSLVQNHWGRISPYGQMGLIASFLHYISFGILFSKTYQAAIDRLTDKSYVFGAMLSYKDKDAKKEFDEPFDEFLTSYLMEKCSEEIKVNDRKIGDVILGVSRIEKIDHYLQELIHREIEEKTYTKKSGFASDEDRHDSSALILEHFSEGSTKDAEEHLPFQLPEFPILACVAENPTINRALSRLLDERQDGSSIEDTTKAVSSDHTELPKSPRDPESAAILTVRKKLRARQEHTQFLLDLFSTTDEKSSAALTALNKDAKKSIQDEANFESPLVIVLREGASKDQEILRLNREKLFKIVCNNRNIARELKFRGQLQAYFHTILPLFDNNDELLALMQDWLESDDKCKYLDALHDESSAFAYNLLKRMYANVNESQQMLRTRLMQRAFLYEEGEDFIIKETDISKALIAIFGVTKSDVEKTQDVIEAHPELLNHILENSPCAEVVLSVEEPRLKQFLKDKILRVPGYGWDILKLARTTKAAAVYFENINQHLANLVRSPSEEIVREFTADDVANIVRYANSSVVIELFMQDKFVEQVISASKDSALADCYILLFELLAKGAATHYLIGDRSTNLFLSQNCTNVLFDEFHENQEIIFELWLRAHSNVSPVAPLSYSAAPQSGSDTSHSSAEEDVLDDQHIVQLQRKQYQQLFAGLSVDGLEKLVAYCNNGEYEYFSLPNSLKETVFNLVERQLPELCDAIFLFLQPEWVSELLGMLTACKQSEFLKFITPELYKRFFESPANQQNLTTLKALLDTLDQAHPLQVLCKEEGEEEYLSSASLN